MPGQRRRTYAAGRRRAPSTWARDVTTTFVTVPAGNKALLLSIALNNPGIGETIRRSRGMLMIASDQSAAVEQQLGALGLVVVSDLALAAGAASIPGPVTDSSDDGWFVWQPFLANQAGASIQPSQSRAVFDFDSKAMRRIEEGFGVAVMVENASALHGLNFWCAFSVLTSIS